jgi:MFS family permease
LNEAATPAGATPDAAAVQDKAAPEAALAPPEAAAEKTGLLVPMIIGASMFIYTLDGTIISNALPSMAKAMGENPVTLDLAITSYMVSTAVFLPISAWVADRFGAKAVLCAAIICFGAASLLCGFSQNLPELVGARILQGAAGAMMLPVARLVILRSVPKSQLVQAMSYFTIPALLGPVLEPPLEGFIVTY